MERPPRPDENGPDGDEDKNDEQKITRRAVLRSLAGTAMFYGLGNMDDLGDADLDRDGKGREIPLNKEGVDYAERFIKERGFEGEEEEAPGLGKFEEEAKVFSYFLLPRTGDEVEKLKDFLRFVHGKEYREKIADQLQMFKVDPISFDEQGWDFYDKYFRGERLAKISAKGRSKEKLVQEYNSLVDELKEGGIEQKLAEDIAEVNRKKSLNEMASKAGKEVTLNMSEFRFKALPPSVVTRHEMDHITQYSDDVVQRPVVPGGSSAKEVISIFDGVAAVLIDKEMRRLRRLATESEYVGEDEPGLYDEPIVFPSGATYTAGKLAKLAEQFYNLRDEEDFERTAVQLFSSPEAIQFFDRLVYGDPGRSKKISDRWRRAMAKQEHAVERIESNYSEYVMKLFQKHKDKPLWSHLFGTEDPKEIEATVRDEAENYPEYIHRIIVRSLQIENDPIYEVVNAGYSDTGDSTIIERRRSPSSILRDVIEQDPKAKSIWHAHEFLTDSI